MPFFRMSAIVLAVFLGTVPLGAAAANAGGADARPWTMEFSPSMAPVAYEGFEGNPPVAIPAIVTSEQAPAPAAGTAQRMRQVLADFAVTLRDVRYRRGGSQPSTGFDCSGFVRYVFQHVLGRTLPTNSASQFRAVGTRVDRAEMRTGDLVFFRTRGKQVSHVGIYLDNGRFIHSPSAGKSVSISSLDEAYWARRFAGARRPDGLT